MPEIQGNINVLKWPTKNKQWCIFLNVLWNVATVLIRDKSMLEMLFLLKKRKTGNKSVKNQFHKLEEWGKLKEIGTKTWNTKQKIKMKRKLYY